MASISDFLKAQSNDYAQALKEIRNGRKETHWIWYIFPQLKALGRSGTAKFYGLENLAEAQAYYDHPILGARLIEISRALAELDENDPNAVMGYPDDLKLRSCMTLFSQLPNADPVFEAVLAKYFNGEGDPQTLALL